LGKTADRTRRAALDPRVATHAPREASCSAVHRPAIQLEREIIVLAAIYARCSTDRQSETSPEDQARPCGERALLLGLEVVAFFEYRAALGGVPIAGRAGGRGLLAGALADDLAGEWSLRAEWQPAVDLCLTARMGQASI